MITATDFINGYKEASDKSEYVKQHVVKTYCPILEKKVVLDNLITNNAINTTVHDIPFIDNLLVHINYVIALMLCYTDVRYEDNQEFSQIDFYDAIVEYDIISVIISIIGDREITAFNQVRDYIIDTFYQTTANSNEIIFSHIQKYVDVFKSMNDSILSKIDIDELLLRMNKEV